jgi:divinyl chlorophyllide a 8-vinyl-reductase
LGTYLAGCLLDPSRHNRVLPIGGPGEAITPLQQGNMLFALLGQTPRFKHVPVALLDAIIAVLSVLGRVLPALAAKAELARIGRYYASESMLVWDAQRACYDAAATPSFGTHTLSDHYRDLLSGAATNERRDHAVF